MELVLDDFETAALSVFAGAGEVDAGERVAPDVLVRMGTFKLWILEEY